MAVFRRYLVVCFSVIALSVVTPVHGAVLMSDEVSVLVAEDKTTESDCQLWVSTPTNVQPCPAGTVIMVRATTLSEVKQKKLQHYVVRSSNDDVAEKKLVASMPKPQQSLRVVALSSCSTGNKSFGANYLVEPSNPSSKRVYTEVQYRVIYDNIYGCIVDSVKDRARVSAGEWKWLQTCVRGVDSQCTARGDTMITAFSLYKPANFTSVPGSYYAHISDRPNLFAGRPYVQVTWS